MEGQGSCGVRRWGGGGGEGGKRTASWTRSLSLGPRLSPSPTPHPRGHRLSPTPWCDYFIC